MTDNLTQRNWAIIAILLELQHQEKWAYPFLNDYEKYYLFESSTFSFPKGLKKLILN